MWRFGFLLLLFFSPLHAMEGERPPTPFAPVDLRQMPFLRQLLEGRLPALPAPGKSSASVPAKDSSQGHTSAKASKKASKKLRQLTPLSLTIDPTQRQNPIAGEKRVASQTSPVLDNSPAIIDELELVLREQENVKEHLAWLSEPPLFSEHDSRHPLRGARNIIASLMLQKRYILDKYKKLQEKITNFPVRLKVSKSTWARVLEKDLNERLELAEGVDFKNIPIKLLATPVAKFLTLLQEDVVALGNYKKELSKRVWAPWLPDVGVKDVKELQQAKKPEGKRELPQKVAVGGRLVPLEEKKSS